MAGLVGSLVLLVQPAAAAPTGAAVPFACLDFSSMSTSVANAAAEGEIDQPEAQYVFALYVTLVGRTPSESEIAAWEPMLEAGDLLGVSRGIGFSEEARAHQVYCTYLQILGRNAETAGAEFWTDKVMNGLGYEDLVATFMASPEAIAAHSAAATQVDADIIAEAYEFFLDRAAGDDEIAYWLDQIDAGESLLDVLLFIAHSDEFAEATVVGGYDFVLDRAPDEGGLEFWTAFLKAHGVGAYIVEFVGQPEAYDTALGF